MIISIDKILIEYNIQKIIYEYPVKPQDVFDNYMDLFTYYFIIKFDIDKKNGTYSLGKLPNLAYYQKAIKFILDLIVAYKNEGVNMDINKTNLLTLDMNQIGYLLFSKKREIRNGIFEYKDIFYSDDDFIGYFPIRFDLSEISPHHYNYNKKYLRI